MADNSAEIRRQIDATKLLVSEKYSVCRAAAKKLVSVYGDLVKAEESREVKNNNKTVAKCVKAEGAFKLAKKEYSTFLAFYDELVRDVTNLYDELINGESSGKAAKKLRAEAGKFEAREAAMRAKLLETVREIDISEELQGKAPVTEIKISPEAEEKKAPEAPKSSPVTNSEPLRTAPQAPNYAQPYYPAYDMYQQPQRQGVNIAPASIDISDIVEDAVEAAMKKFKALFEKRADAYINSLPKAEIKQSENNSANSELSSAAIEMEAEILEGERAIAEKLGALIENIKALSQELTELGAQYIEISGVQKDAAEAQRKTNDMQRAVVREIQGVQANQKVINQEQASLVGEQAALIEHQKVNIENQKMLETAQEEIAQMQKSILEAQSVLHESVRGVVTSQKGVINEHHSVINESSENAERVRELSEKQSEITALQKAAASEHEQLVRDVMGVSDAEDVSENATVASEADEIIESVVPEEVALDELKAEE